MATTLEEVKEKVKEQADLAQIIGRHTKLVKGARGFKACCPLPGHKEKSPSFHINTQDNYFYCYGCQRGGDVFKFLEYVEGLPFMEALKELAASLNIEMPKSREAQAPGYEEKKDEKDLGFDLLQRAGAFFHRYLMESGSKKSEDALTYLFNRGISKEEIEELKLGWAPEAGNVLASKIKDKKELEVAQALGLVRQRMNSAPVDFFRSRLIIPISDHKAKIVAFSGRTLDAVTSENPKYFNSTESAWFKKKSIFYGLDRAAKFIKNDNFVCIVEGYFDQWAFHRAEIPAVAVMGTALTEEHLNLLGRFTKQVVLVMDTDQAGINSTKRSLPLLLEKGFYAKVFSDFKGKDPDEWLAENKKSFMEVKQKIKASSDGLEWLAKTILNESQKLNLPRVQTLDMLREVWQMTRNEAQKTVLADEISLVLGLDRDAIKKSLDDLLKTNPLPAPNRKLNAADNTEVRYVSSFPLSNQRVAPYKKPLSSTLEKLAEETFVFLLWSEKLLTCKSQDEWEKVIFAFKGSSAGDFFAEFFEKWKENPDISIKKYAETYSKAHENNEIFRRWVLKGWVLPDTISLDDENKINLSFQELMNALRIEGVRHEIARLQSELRKTSGGSQDSVRILQEVRDLSFQLEKSK